MAYFLAQNHLNNRERKKKKNRKEIETRAEQIQDCIWRVVGFSYNKAYSCWHH